MASNVSLILLAIFVTATIAQNSSWKRWDRSLKVPSDAFSAGFDCKGKKIYVGRVKINGVFKTGRVYFQASGNRKAGIYVDDKGSECFRNRYIDYYVKNSNCNYAWVISTNGAVVNNAVLTSDAGSTYIGRFFAKKCLTVGRVVIGDKMYYSPNFSATKYKVLVCNPKPTVPPTAAPTEPPTAAPTEPPTAAPAEPQGCTLTCSNGVLDIANCRCCDFADAAKYFSLKTDLANIESQSSGNTNMKTQIDTLKQNIADIENAVIGTCGSAPPETISGFFEIAGQSLQKLNLTLEEFKFSLGSGKCTLSCDEVNGYVPVWSKCQCIYLEGYQKLMVAKKTYSQMQSSLLRILYDTEEYYNQYSAYRLEFNYMWQVISGIQYNWGQYSLEEMYAKITEVEQRTNAAWEKLNTYISSAPGTCGNACEYFSIAEVSNACQCDRSELVINFYNNFEQFIGLENEITFINYKNYTDDKIRFQDWAKEVRRKATVVFRGISVDGFTAEQKQQAVTEFINDYLALKAEWEAFKPKLVTPPCTIECTGDTVRTCNPCQCAPVSGYDNLLNVIYPDMSSILSEISSLTAEDSYKTTLTNNANTIKGGIDQVKALNCNGLVVSDVTNACNQLTTLYSTLKSQILEVKNNAASSSGCAVTCPNERYVKDLEACKCICLPFTCNAATENVDNYNCQCVPK